MQESNSINVKKNQNPSKSIFDILKQGTSLRNQSKDVKIANQIQQQKPNAMHHFLQSVDKNQFHKYNPSDSDSDYDRQDELVDTHSKNQELLNKKRKNSFSLQEKNDKKKINILKEKEIIRRKLNHIQISGESQFRIAHNFTYFIRNLLAIAPTGSGKTVAFALPLLAMLESHKFGLRAIIMAPTVELAEQIYREIMELSSCGTSSHNQDQIIKIAIVNRISKTSSIKPEQVSHNDILIATPLKLLKLLKKGVVDISSVENLVMDEADRYFELGLAKQIKQILEIFKPTKTIYSLFSATIQYEVEQLLNNFLLDPIKIQIGGKNNVLKNVEQKLVYVGCEDAKLIELRNMLQQGQFKPPALIFVQSKERAVDLYQELSEKAEFECMRVGVIHANMSQDERSFVFTQFRMGECWTLICTDLMARGIDFKGVNLVINFDFPQTIITYIHRVGRTGRMQMPGKAITFFCDADQPMLRSLGNVLKISGCNVPAWILQRDKIKRKDRKHLQKYPLKRETISTKIDRNIDQQFVQEMKEKDIIHLKREQKKILLNPNLNNVIC